MYICIRRGFIDVKSNLIHRLLSIPAIGMMMLYAASVYAQAPAATTVDKATRITDVTNLSVQSGSNFIRIEPNYLPATVTYTPGSVFGPLPAALVTDQELTPSVIFSDCKTVWQWELPRTEKATIMEIKAHESATILVEPLVCPESTEMTAEVWDSIKWEGQLYTESGDYTLDFTDGNGCEYSHTLHLTVHYTLYDTVPMTDCDSLIYNEKKYTEDGIYRIDTTALPTGDRQINFIDLTLRHSTEFEMTVAQYEPYLAPWDKTYPESGDYTETLTNTAGCDSVITLHLTIFETAYDTLRLTDCDSIRFEDVKYTSSCSFNDTIVAEDGNRLIKTMEFTIHYSSLTQISVSQYEPYISGMGKTYGESGEYEERTKNRFGCDSVIILNIQILDHNEQYDTVYFCRGYNRIHDERISDDLVRRYRLYTYQSPAEWDYMEGVVLAEDNGRTLMDLARAEENLRNHYVKGLTPVERITWSVRYNGSSAFTPIVVENQPQWLEPGRLAVQIMFLCGEIFNNSLPMDVENIEPEHKTIKRIKNGQVVIMRGGEKYNLFGLKIQ